MIRVFNHWFPTTTVAEAALDALLLAGCVALALVWLGQGGRPDMPTALPYALLFAVSMVTLSAALGFYDRFARRSAAQTWFRAAASLVLAAPIAYSIFALLPDRAVRRELVYLVALAGLAALLLWRGYARERRIGRGLALRRVLVLGMGREAAALDRLLKAARGDIEVVGFYPVQGDEDVHVPADRILPAGMSVGDAVAALKADDVIVAMRERRGGVMPLQELLDCKLAGVGVLDLASFFERTLGQVRLDSLRASWLIFGEGFSQGVVRTVVKRLFDVLAASLLLVAMLPLMLVTAALIAAESGFPIFYRQERVGLGGRLFKVIKFRSMRSDAERDGKPRWAAANDSRVTRVGRVIRKARIDELPQLLNVLWGDMSLVGPRPERPFFVDQLTREIPFYAARHSVKPGLTGWAQVRYHYGASVDDAAQKLQYDLFYVKNHSLLLDFVVLFETVGVVVTGAGAH